MERKWLVGILRYGLGLLIALLIFWGFYGFIKDDNWLAVSALATLILAIAAFWAIWQNYNFRRQEKKERLLNEIIEWAIDVTKGLGEEEFSPIMDLKDIGLAHATITRFFAQMRHGFQDKTAIGLYVKDIAPTFG